MHQHDEKLWMDELTQRLQKLLKVFRRLHSPFSWEVCNFSFHFAPPSSFFTAEVMFADLMQNSVVAFSELFSSSVCICASFHWLPARLNLMLVQPMLRLVAGRDSPPSPLPTSSFPALTAPLHHRLWQSGERFESQLENALPAMLLMSQLGYWSKVLIVFWRFYFF